MKFKISISIQISIFLLILIFIPIASMMALHTYENQQLSMMESSNVQQGRLVAASLFCTEKISSDEAVALLKNMDGNFDARIRVLDKSGALIADSSTVENDFENENSQTAQTQLSVREMNYDSAVNKNSEKSNSDASENFIYRLLSIPVRIYRSYFKRPYALKYDSAEFYINKNIYDGEEVLAALEGRYGSATRISYGGQRSVTLYSALPVYNSLKEVCGVVLVSKSTYKILLNLYELRLDLGKIFLWSLGALFLIALFLNFRISYPLKKLSRQTVECADKKGTVRFEDFTGKKRRDEIGQLSRSFSELVKKLNKRIHFADAFSADISHEFKNPLAAIRNCADILGNPKIPENQKEEFRQAISEEVSRLEQLLNGIRTISKLDASEEENEFYLPVNVCLENTLNRLKKSYPQTRIDFNSSEKTSGVKLNLAEEPFVRMVENFVDNAASFGDRIIISSDVTENKKTKFYSLSVEDNGKGIEPEEIEKIFNRFYSNRTDSEKQNHSGLGLSIVKAVVENSEGKILVEKSTVLGGAKFTVLFPVMNEKNLKNK